MKAFLSSTRATLEEERDALFEALSGPHEVVRMENFGSRGESALETCLRELEQCDVSVTLLGHQYGTIVPRYNASYTETEYEHARVSRVDVHAYIKAGFEDALDTADYPERLREFRDALRHGLTVQQPEFESVPELVTRVAEDLDALAERRARRPLFRDRVGAIADPAAYGHGSWRHNRLVMHPFPITIVELPVIESDVYPDGPGRRLAPKVTEVLNGAKKMGTGAVIFNRIPVPDPGPMLDQRLIEARTRSSAIVCFARRQSDLPELARFAGTDAQLLIWYPEGAELPEDRPQGFYQAYTDNELQNCAVALQVLDRLDYLVNTHLTQTA